MIDRGGAAELIGRRFLTLPDRLFHRWDGPEAGEVDRERFSAAMGRSRREVAAERREGARGGCGTTRGVAPRSCGWRRMIQARRPSGLAGYALLKPECRPGTMVMRPCRFGGGLRRERFSPRGNYWSPGVASSHIWSEITASFTSSGFEGEETNQLHDSFIGRTLRCDRSNG
jgi:hypothetical protein